MPDRAGYAEQLDNAKVPANTKCSCKGKLPQRHAKIGIDSFGVERSIYLHAQAQQGHAHVDHHRLYDGSASHSRHHNFAQQSAAKPDQQ